jgi:prophage DNA circulation protein
MADAGYGTAWRAHLVLASYKGAYFHCENNAREAGRRIVQHEFPKREMPYAEDMGHRAQAFTLRGYCITYVRDMTDAVGSKLFRKDYTVVRDLLRTQLDSEGPGSLQLPTQPAQWVVCSQYKLTEEERFGGYCVFDMSFQEFGLDPSVAAPTQATAQNLILQSIAARQALIRLLAIEQGKTPPIQLPPVPPVLPLPP